jgi:lipopolysaccharide transport system permease protein
VASERLVTKIYFPRLVVPFATVGAAVVDFVIAFGLLLAMMAYYRVPPGPGIMLLPIIFLAILLAALGVGTLLAALNVSYRDFRYVIPFLVQLWMFATPSVYMETTTRPPAAMADGAAAVAPQGATAPSSGGTHRLLRAALAANPMTGLIRAFRAASLGGPIPWRELGSSSVCAALALVVGCLYFRWVEDGFADII